MLILTRYLFREIVGPFIFGVSAFTALMLGFALIPLAQQPGLGAQTVFRLAALTIPEYLALAFPMGILLGTLFTLGRLSSHSEVVAMRASGLTGFQLMLPFLVFGVFASLASLYLSQVVVPHARQAYTHELARARGQTKITVLRRQTLPPEYDRDGTLKRLVYVDAFDLERLHLHGAIVQEFDRGQQRTNIQADEMVWDGGAWRFQRGSITFFHGDGRISRLTVRDGQADYRPLLPEPAKMAAAMSAPPNPEQMTWYEYQSFITRRARRGEDVRRLLVDLYTRLAVPFACLALALVGTPLGIQSHRAGATISFGLSIGILIVYFFLLSFGQVLGRTGIIPPTVAAWSANIVLCGVGIGLFIKRMH